MKFQVTAEDIENGVKGSPGFCPVAHALNRITRFNWYIYEYQFRCMYNTKEFDRFDVPVYVSKIIKKYDKTNNMEPFEFDLPMK